MTLDETSPHQSGTWSTFAIASFFSINCVRVDTYAFLHAYYAFSFLSNSILLGERTYCVWGEEGGKENRVPLVNERLGSFL